MINAGLEWGLVMIDTEISWLMVFSLISYSKWVIVRKRWQVMVKEVAHAFHDSRCEWQTVAMDTRYPRWITGKDWSADSSDEHEAWTIGCS